MAARGGTAQAVAARSYRWSAISRLRICTSHAREESFRPGQLFADAAKADRHQPAQHPTENGTECLLTDGTDICHPPEEASTVSGTDLNGT